MLDTNKTYPKRRDYLFSFNLNLDLLTLAHENLYFKTLDLEKVLKVGVTPPLRMVHPRYRGMKEMPTPDQVRVHTEKQQKTMQSNIKRVLCERPFKISDVMSIFS